METEWIQPTGFERAVILQGKEIHVMAPEDMKRLRQIHERPPLELELTTANDDNGEWMKVEDQPE